MTRRKTLIIHVGPFKTGSTYIQMMLCENREKLAQQGVSYSARHIGSYGHHSFSTALTEGACNPGSPECNAFRTAFLAQDINIISSEELSRLTRPRLIELQNIFWDCDVHIAYFLRHPINMLPSLWQEMVKHGSDQSFLEFWEAMQDKSSSYPRKAYSNLEQLKRISSVFRSDRVSVFSYDNIVSNGGDIFRSFISKCTPPHIDLENLNFPLYSPNMSMDLVQVEFLRCLNIVSRDEFPTDQPANWRKEFARDRSAILVDPNFIGFSERLHDSQHVVRLRSDDPLFSTEEDQILDIVGSSIVNKTQNSRIFDLPKAIEKQIPSAPRSWIYQTPQINYIRELLNRFRRG